MRTYTGGGHTIEVKRDHLARWSYELNGKEYGHYGDEESALHWAARRVGIDEEQWKRVERRR